MNKLVMLLTLAASAALAQPAVNRGGFVKKNQYQLYRTTTLYVDGDQGSNSNTCTAAGTSACLTINGALAKLGRFSNGFNATINVAAAADGGVKEYAGFSTGLLQGARYVTSATDGGITVSGLGSILPFVTVNGTRILAQGVTGATQGTITSYDAGGIRLDGGSIYDSSVLSSVTVAGAGWTPDQLKDKFFTILRADGGLAQTPIPIYTNTSDTIFPVYQVPASTYALGPTLQVVEPGTRITSAVSHGGEGSLTLNYFDFGSSATPFVSQLSLTEPDSFVTVNYGRFYPAINRVINVVNNQNFTINQSHIKTTGVPSYFINGVARTATLSVQFSGIEGLGQAVYSLLGSGVLGTLNWRFNTMRDHLYSFATFGCPAAPWQIDGNRFIRVGSGIAVECLNNASGSMVYAQANYFDNVTGSAIYVRGQTKLSTLANFAGQDSIATNVGGFGIVALSGAQVLYNPGQAGDTPLQGALGQFGIGDCDFTSGGAYPGSFSVACPITPYTAQFLYDLAPSRCIVSTATTTRVCLSL